MMRARTIATTGGKSAQNVANVLSFPIETIIAVTIDAAATMSAMMFFNFFLTIEKNSFYHN